LRKQRPDSIPSPHRFSATAERSSSVDQTHIAKDVPPAGQMLGQCPHQTFHRLVLHQTDAYESEVLQARSKKVNPLAGAIEKLHFHLPKIVLTELSGE